MKLADILGALKGATAAERDEFKKGLDALDAGGAKPGMTREQLDGALEPFKKGAGSPADFGGAGKAAELDVTGWLGQLTAQAAADSKAVQDRLDAFAKGFLVFGEQVGSQVLALTKEVEEFRKGLTKPGNGAAVLGTGTNGGGNGSFSKGGNMPGPGNNGQGGNGGGVVHPENGGGGAERFANLTEGELVQHLRNCLESEAVSPAVKGKVATAITEVEIDYAIDEKFFDRLGINPPPGY